MEPMLEALARILQPETLLVIVLSGFFGLLVGSIPGLTATMAVALLVPMTYFLSETAAIASIVTLTAFAIFAGDIPATLLRIPGTPSSAAYADDCFALRRRGRHFEALGASLLFSVFGGLFGTVILILFAPQLAVVAEKFSSHEYFWLYAIGLSCAAVVSGESRLRGAIALLIGMLFSMVGLSEVHSQPRFTFGREEIYSGVQFIPAMIGLFGMSEVLRGLWREGAFAPASEETSAVSEAAIPSEPFRAGPIFRNFFSRLFAKPLRVVRSSGLGTLIGMVPGAGADIAAWISYALSKKSSETPDEYGRGSLEGISDASAANNASLAGAWIPALVLGIPGDSVTAILLGVLMMKDVNPGPALFSDPAQVVRVDIVYLSFIVANLLLIPLGLLAIRTGALILRVPRTVLLPVILLFCVIGSYAISGSRFDVAVMIFFGVLGFGLEHFRFPLGPVVLGILLGSQLESSFVQCTTKNPTLWGFFDRPLSAALGTICLLLWCWPLLRKLVAPRPDREP